MDQTYFPTFAFLALLAGRVVLALARHIPAVWVYGALAGVAVTLAAASDSQIRDADPFADFVVRLRLFRRRFNLKEKPDAKSSLCRWLFKVKYWLLI